MLTGRQTFAGVILTDVIAQVVTGAARLERLLAKNTCPGCVSPLCGDLCRRTRRSDCSTSETPGYSWIRRSRRRR